MKLYSSDNHYTTVPKEFIVNKVDWLKKVRIRMYSCPYFLTFRRNTDQNNSKYGHFLRSGQIYIKGWAGTQANICNGDLTDDDELAVFSH